MKGWCPLRQQPPSHTSAWHGPWTGRAIQRGKRDAAACVPHPIAVPGRLGTPRLPPSPMPRDPISSPGPASPRLASSHCACSKADLIMVTNEADGNAGHRRSSKSCWVANHPTLSAGRRWGQGWWARAVRGSASTARTRILLLPVGKRTDHRPLPTGASRT